MVDLLRPLLWTNIDWRHRKELNAAMSKQTCSKCDRERAGAVVKANEVYCVVYKINVSDREN